MYEEQSQRPPEPFVFSVFGNQGNVNLSPPHLVEGVQKPITSLYILLTSEKRLTRKKHFYTSIALKKD